MWRERRSFAIERRNAERQVSSGSAYDRSEYDRWCEVIRINDRFEVSTELLGRLIVKVKSNPYPGEQKRVLKLAMDLIPEGGKSGWCAIFRDSDLNFPPYFENERIRFPAEVSINVRDIEKKLWELVREDGTIPAGLVSDALCIEPRSKVYRQVRDKLEERGWVWFSRREGGKVTKVVLAPQEGETVLQT